MQERHFNVKMEWDEEVGVWYVAETDVPGLVAEAETLDELHDKLCTLIPELVSLNRHLLEHPAATELPVYVSTGKLERIPLDA